MRGSRVKQFQNAQPNKPYTQFKGTRRVRVRIPPSTRKGTRSPTVEAPCMKFVACSLGRFRFPATVSRTGCDATNVAVEVRFLPVVLDAVDSWTEEHDF
jgi:hypothetical protein